ncbi:MAG: DUF6268 family outer membrane beta-barrel protein [candidate division Zixibacteria bacterium]
MHRKSLLRQTTVTALFVVVALALGQGSRADGISLVSFSYELVPKAELDIYNDRGEELAVEAQTFTSKLALPILIDGKRTIVLNFLTFRWMRQSYDNANADRNFFRPDLLYTLKYGFVFRQVLSDRWSVAMLVQPALLTDGVNTGINQLLLRAGFLFEKKVNPRFKYAIGMGYSDDYGSEKVLPVVQLGYKPNDRWNIKLDLPQKITAMYKMSERVKAGLQAKVTGGHFRIGEDFRLTDGSTTANGRVKYSIVNVGPAIDLSLYKGVAATINTGLSVYRRFQLYDADGDMLREADFERSWFLKVRLAYNVGG